MDEKTKEEILNIISQFSCPEDFICYHSGFKILCKTKEFNGGSLYECMEEDPTTCSFALSYGFNTHFCRCPLRQYLAKKLKMYEPDEDNTG